MARLYTSNARNRCQNALADRLLRITNYLAGSL